MDISEVMVVTAEWAVTMVAMAVGLLVVAYLYEPYRKVWRVPGPVPLPLIGHLHLLAMHGPDVFSVLARKHGPVFRGPRWTSMRNMIISIYQPSHLASLIPTMESCIQRATKNLDGQKEITFSGLSLSLATDVIGQAAFGTDFGLSKVPVTPDDSNIDKIAADTSVEAKASSEFIKMHMHATTSLKMDLSGSLSILVGMLLPFLQEPFRQVLKRIPGMGDYKIDRVNRALRTQMDRIVAERGGAMEHDLAASHQRKDFLSVMLTARESNKSSRELLTPDYISALTYEHLLAGSTTTAFTLSTVLYLVAKHPEVEEKLLREIDGFGPRDRVPMADDLQTKFPYLDQVVKESMRFYMVSPLVARETHEQGTWVWLAPGVLAKDPKNFPEPEVFRPERFDPNGEEERRRHPYAFIPFGIGPRVCIGQKFSIQEIKLSVIHLYRHYVFRHSPSMESPLEFQFAIICDFKYGVKLQVIKRHNAEVLGATAEWAVTLVAMAVGLLLVAYLYEPYRKVWHVPGPVHVPLIGHLHLLAMHGPDVGPRWTSMRNMIISIYQPSHLASLIPTMESCIQRASKNLDGQKEITFSDLSLSLATDVIGLAAFGTDFGLSKVPVTPDDSNIDKIAADTSVEAKASSEFIKMHMHATTSLKMDLSGSLSILVGMLLPFLQEPFRQVLKRIPGMGDYKIDRVNRALKTHMDSIVAEREAAMEHDLAASQQRKDFLSVVLTARESNKSSRELLTPDYISALTYEHLLAGSTTTAFTLSTVLYLVAKHPEVEEKLLREIDAFGPRDRVPMADDLQTKFPYLDQVVKESMRFYMMSPLIARETLEQGTWVWLAPGVLAKDPKKFPEPEIFRPERFDPNGEEERRRHPYAFIPFGIGPRVCIGRKFSIQEIKLSVIHLYRHYVFRHSPSMESPLEFQFAIICDFKYGVKLQAIKRQHA
uniref:Uncharacterized protein n=1 Tax=Oryza glumipatula TaxID=40148 RepID=A0A0D9YDP8_9ORYZ